MDGISTYYSLTWYFKERRVKILLKMREDKALQLFLSAINFELKNARLTKMKASLKDPELTALTAFITFYPYELVFELHKFN